MSGDQPWTLHPDDELLLDRLRAVAAVADPVPASVRSAALGAFAWRDVDTELLELLEDSALTPTSGHRGDDGPRLLTFGEGEDAVVVEVGEIGPSGTTPAGREESHRRLLGQILTPGASTIEVRSIAGTVVVDVDELGVFRVDDIAAGPVSLAFSRGGERRVVTTWVSV